VSTAEFLNGVQLAKSVVKTVALASSPQHQPLSVKRVASMNVNYVLLVSTLRFLHRRRPYARIA